jgi:type I restriction enzyme R subunit
VIDRWFEDRSDWLRARGINPLDANWREQLLQLGREAAREFLHHFWNRWHDILDAGSGACVLRQRGLADIVARSLLHFDRERHVILDFVVLPNHIHLLASFPDDQAMLAQCQSWKHYTATSINRRLNQTGRFWQKDAFDHLVRSEQHEYLRRYNASNPGRAGLLPGEFAHYSAKDA